MYETKLIDIIINLNFEERRKLRKWVNSEFVNKNKDISTFFEFIDSRKKITPRTVTKEKAHEYLYPNQPYHDLRIRHLIWMTTEIVEEFIAYLGINNELSLKEELLFKFYAQKDLNKHAQKSIENGFAIMNNSKIKNAEYYKTAYNLHSHYYDIHARNVRTTDFNIQDVVNAITIFTTLETLKISSRILSIQKVGETNTQHPLLLPILKILEDKRYLELPQIRIYYHIYCVATNEDEYAFAQFLKDIQKHESLFSNHDLIELYRFAVNFCIKKSNQNVLSYTQKAFELYLYAVKKSYFIENQEISRFTFTNIIALGIKLKAYKKVEQFMSTYAKYIDIQYRKNTVDFNKAKLFYATQQTDKALKILLTIELKDIIWNLNAKHLVLKILFEHQDMEQLSAQVKNLKKYVENRSNIGYHKTYFLNVTTAFRQLIKLSAKPEKMASFHFDPQVPDAAWFNQALQMIPKNKNAPK